MQCQTDLLEVVFALRPPRGLTGLLHCRQQKSNQNCDNGDND
jgi:hypothetical protein